MFWCRGIRNGDRPTKQRLWLAHNSKSRDMQRNHFAWFWITLESKPETVSNCKFPVSVLVGFIHLLFLQTYCRFWSAICSNFCSLRKLRSRTILFVLDFDDNNRNVYAKILGRTLLVTVVNCRLLLAFVMAWRWFEVENQCIESNQIKLFWEVPK